MKYKMFKNILILVAVSIIAIAATSCKSGKSEQQQNFENGNYQYGEKNYAAAIKNYELITLSGQEAFEIYYNLGNSYFRAGDYPRAILNYERAVRLEPRNQDNLNNLALANSKIRDRFENMPELKIIRLWKNFSTVCSSAAWAFITVAFVALLFTSIFFYLMYSAYKTKRISFYAGLTALLCVGISVAAAFTEYNRENEDTAIVMAFSTDLLSAPDPSQGTAKATIHAGSKINITDQANLYYRVRLPNGEKGFIFSGDVERVLQ
jgi:tetratricopeptide (TPR) repeat protein